MSGAYTVVSNCIIRGKPCRKGDTVTLDDADAAALLTMGRVEPANAATEGRVRTADVVTWKAGEPHMDDVQSQLWVRRHP